MAYGKVGRPRRDQARAAVLGKRIESRLSTLNMTRREFAMALGVSPQAVWLYVHGRRDPASASVSGKIARALLWTNDELVSGTEANFARTSASDIGQSLLAEFSRIVGRPLRDLSDTNWLYRLGSGELTLAVRACLQTLPRIRALTSGLELTGARSILDAVIEVASAGCRTPVKDAAILLFDAADQRAHCASFVLPPSTLLPLARPDLALMAEVILGARKADRELIRRWRVRRGDIRKICGRSLGAFEDMRWLLEDSERKALADRLSYPAYRTSCVLAAELASHREFLHVIHRARQAIDSGYLPPHDVATILEGIADAFAIRFGRTKHRPFREVALTGYAEAASHFTKADQHRGGEHVEFSLRLQMRPLTFLKAGIPDLVSVAGMSPNARGEELARELLALATQTNSERTAQRLQETIRSVRA